MSTATKRRVIGYGIAIGLIVADAAVTAIVKALSGPDLGIPATVVALIVAIGAQVEADIHTAESAHSLASAAPVPPAPPQG